MRLLVVDPNEVRLRDAITDALLSGPNTVTYVSAVSCLSFPPPIDTMYPDFEPGEHVYRVYDDGKFFRIMCGLA